MLAFRSELLGPCFGIGQPLEQGALGRLCLRKIHVLRRSDDVGKSSKATKLEFESFVLNNVINARYQIGRRHVVTFQFGNANLCRSRMATSSSVLVQRSENVNKPLSPCAAWAVSASAGANGDWDLDLRKTGRARLRSYNFI